MGDPVAHGARSDNCNVVDLHHKLRAKLMVLTPNASHALDDYRARLTTADADCGKTALCASLLHRVEKRYQNARTARANRVTEGDGTAVDIDLLNVES